MNKSNIILIETIIRALKMITSALDKWLQENK